jgi:Transposase
VVDTGKGRDVGPSAAASVKRTRWALVKDPGRLSTSQRLVLEELRRGRSVLYRAWQLQEALRDVYRLRDLGAAHQSLDRWLAWACRSRNPAFVKLSKTIRAHRDGILAAVELGVSNSKLEGLNSKIRLINHRGYGHHSASAVIAMIYLCCGASRSGYPRKGEENRRYFSGRPVHQPSDAPTSTTVSTWCLSATRLSALAIEGARCFRRTSRPSRSNAARAWILSAERPGSHMPFQSHTTNEPIVLPFAVGWRSVDSSSGEWWGEPCD